MIKVSVTNSVNGRQFGSEFPDEASADAWIAQEVANNDWGKAERWISETSPMILLEDLSKSDDSRETEVMGETIVERHFPVEYTISISDVTAEYQAQQLLDNGLRAQAVGAMVVAKVWAINEAKLSAGTLNDSNFQAILADATLQQIERLLWNGSLKTAKTMISAYSSPAFSTDEKASIIAIIDDSGLI